MLTGGEHGDDGNDGEQRERLTHVHDASSSDDDTEMVL